MNTKTYTFSVLAYDVSLLTKKKIVVIISPTSLLLINFFGSDSDDGKNQRCLDGAQISTYSSYCDH